ncbi:MAG: metallophosphoesterase [Lunatimonas sp.]|uniref:metallophosphoesterase n=1 Tax=Lunatimonas sp. TaxID=2060141 RepID=UPI00263B5441|nr:metallophosphoesterase [Lunatimonas sp.]MCC5935683.1 metallophosphoesterase [Lunatimonas sp.]
MNRTLPLLSTFLFVATGLLFAQQHPDNRPGFLIHPYLQYSTQTEISILWETTHPASTQVMYGPSQFNTGKAILSESVGNSQHQTMHEVTLTSLEAETNYFYRVLSVTEAGDTIQSDVIPFRTAVHKESAFAFTVFSDSQNNPEVWANVTHHAFEERPNFAVHAGDLVGLGYRKNEWIQEFFAPAKHFMKQIPIFSTLGNHEHDAAYYYQYMKNPDPEHYYTFSYGNADFFMIDTDQYQKPGTPLYLWLERALATSQATWKFVVQHHPPYSSEENDYGNTQYESSEQGDDEARLLVPLYEKYGVDMVFSGHLHMYERTWPILNGRVVEKNGVRYFILGGSGGGLEKAAPTRTWFTNKVRTLHHYAYIAINGNHLQYQAIDQYGSLFDQFELLAPRPKSPASALAPTTPAPSTPQRKFSQPLNVALSTAHGDDELFYTTDGSIPSRKSPRYSKPITIRETTHLQAIAFNKQGAGPVGSYRFEHMAALKPASVSNPKSGLRYIYYTGKLSDPKAPLSSQLQQTASGIIDSYDWNLLPRRANNWGAELTGYLSIPESGYYRFKGHAYQLFRFYLHDQLLIEENTREVGITGEVLLEKGLHPFRIEYHLPDRYDAYGSLELVHPSGLREPAEQWRFFIEQ